MRILRGFCDSDRGMGAICSTAAGYVNFRSQEISPGPLVLQREKMSRSMGCCSWRIQCHFVTGVAGMVKYFGFNHICLAGDVVRIIVGIEVGFRV